MDSAIQLANAMVEFLAFFTPAFITFLVVEWAVSFLRHD